MFVLLECDMRNGCCVGVCVCCVLCDVCIISIVCSIFVLCVGNGWLKLCVIVLGD